jgi:hypothetical protein
MYSQIEETCVCGGFEEVTCCSYCSIVSLLKFNGVEVERWGTGKAKTIRHLIKELNSGETVFNEDDSSRLVRCLSVASAVIYYEDEDNEKLYKLKETKQEFKDGRVKVRENVSSVSEKMNPCENPTDAILRGISEELNIKNVNTISVINMGGTTETLYSESYPTLLSQYNMYKFLVYLNKDQFCIDGYKEEQEDKTTYFNWVECVFE